MRVLYHLPLSPFSRKVRLALAEKRLAFELRVEPVWERRDSFVELNPACEVPVLVEGSLVIADSAVILEYLEESYPDTSLLPQPNAERIEARRIAAWFDHKFHREVTDNLVGEKVLKRISGRGLPDAQALRAGYANLKHHLRYLGWLAETRGFLAGDNLSVADLAAAAQLSSLDFIGDVDWSISSGAKDWYARMKSRPSFRPLLSDRVSGMTPPPHYGDLDF